MERTLDPERKNDLSDLIIVDPVTLLEDPSPNSGFTVPASAARPISAPPGAPAAPEVPAGDAEAVALALQLLGEPAPLAVTADGMSFTMPGWELGAQSADSMDAEGLACWVSTDILLLENGRYVVREHRASEGADGMIESESSGSMMDSGADVRSYCSEFTPDPLCAAARVAALDNAMRRWPPLRSASGRANRTPLAIPFLD